MRFYMIFVKITRFNALTLIKKRKRYFEQPSLLNCEKVLRISHFLWRNQYGDWPNGSESMFWGEI